MLIPLFRLPRRMMERRRQRPGNGEANKPVAWYTRYKKKMQEMHDYWEPGSKSEGKRKGPKAAALCRYRCYPVATQLTIMGSILMASTIAGLAWDFRSSGFILAVLLIVLAILRAAGKKLVFSSRSKRFDTVLTVGLALSLALFSYIAPA